MDGTVEIDDEGYLEVNTEGHTDEGIEVGQEGKRGLEVGKYGN